MVKVIDIEEYKIEKIKKQMLEEYSKYPFTGNYDIDAEILNEEILEFINTNWDKED